MLGDGGIRLQLLVGQVCHSLRRCCEKKGGLYPTHGQDQMEPNEGLFSWSAREHDPKLGDVFRIDPNSVESICNVDLGQVHWAQARVGHRDLLQNAPQGLTKLHGFVGCEWDGVQIHQEERVIAYGTGAVAPLGYDSQQTEAQVIIIQYQVCRQQHPMSLSDHFDKLFTQEISVLAGRLVGAALEGTKLLGSVPLTRLQSYGGSVGP
jgi:hypothetical protein